MPDQFRIGPTEALHPDEGMMYLSINYENGDPSGEMTLRDLLEFLEQKGVDPSAIILTSSFGLLIKTRTT